MPLPRASVTDTLRVLGVVVAPLLARGIIVRRPGVTRRLERVDADARAVALLQRMRRRYGRGPLRLRVPGRRTTVVLDAEDARRVLAESPVPFSPATAEKRRALAHFEPHNVLISRAADRADRRPFHEAALDTGRTVHRGAGAMVAVVRDAADGVLAGAAGGTLTWDGWAPSWMRMVRRLTLGEHAADDHGVTDDMVTLRATANWAFLHPQRVRLREDLLRRLGVYLERAEEGSLAAWAARAPQNANTRPAHQVPQWLFAFDAAGWATYRALALLGSHPDALAVARHELDGRDLGRPQDLPYLRAVVLESLRLWPTTPAVLRETTRPVRFAGGPVPERTLVLVHAPLLHRDDEHVPAAHRFEPGHWLGGRGPDDWPFIPFSAGPVVCPAEDLVLHVASQVLAGVVADHDVVLLGDRLDPARDLPGTLDPFSLRFRVAALERAGRHTA